MTSRAALRRVARGRAKCIRENFPVCQAHPNLGLSARLPAREPTTPFNTGAHGLRVGILPTATGIVFMVGGDYVGDGLVSQGRTGREPE